MIEVARKFRFEASHRLQHHEGACRNLHGHSYEVGVSLMGPAHKSGPMTGMVLDFKLLKSIMSEILFESSVDCPPFDHSVILAEDDELLDVLDAFSDKVESLRIIAFHGEPTAENMAHYFASRVQDALHQRGMTEVEVCSVHVYETEDSVEIWRPNE